jgi:predicted HTH transcriptional regulator
MLTKEELLELIRDLESSRAERTVSVNDTDKFCEAVCAFANDMPDSKQNGSLLVGVHDDGQLKRRCRYSGVIAYNNFPWSQEANVQGTPRTEGTKVTEATKETKRTEGTKWTKGTEATRKTKAVSRSLRSLPSLSSLEGGSNG